METAAMHKDMSSGDSLWLEDAVTGVLYPVTDTNIIKLKNLEGEWCKIYPNTSQNGIVVKST
ncbi:MAG: hypothetical protein KJ607_03165 [Bacteroidetes bacterium]|nr:hypothetical protein [Bacteroidota bacterium]